MALVYTGIFASNANFQCAFFHTAPSPPSRTHSDGSGRSNVSQIEANLKWVLINDIDKLFLVMRWPNHCPMIAEVDCWIWIRLSYSKISRGSLLNFVAHTCWRLNAILNLVDRITQKGLLASIKKSYNFRRKRNKHSHFTIVSSIVKHFQINVCLVLVHLILFRQ